MDVTFVRHTSVDVPRGVCYGQTDVPLKDTFPQEAAHVMSLLENHRFDKVYTSPLSRCAKLAEYCGFADAARERRLMEMNFGDWEMRRFDEIKDPRLQQWYDDYLNVPATNGESFRSQHERVVSFFLEKKALGEDHLLVFTHGGVIMQVMLYAGLATLDNLFSLEPAYGEIRRITI